MSAKVARWMPGGRRVVYGKGRSLLAVEADGSGSRTFASLPGEVISLVWSPDGRTLRCAVDDPPTGSGLWELPAEGGLPRRVYSDPRNRRGDWNGFFSADGVFFLFSSWRDGPPALWGVREGVGFPRRILREPVRLTSGPVEFWGGVASREGRRVFLFGVRPESDVLNRYETGGKRLTPYLPGMHAESASFSRDGSWIACAVGPESMIWRSRPDGSERRQLTFSGVHAHRPAWSPDSSRIAFQGETSGGAPRISIVPFEGGVLQPLPGDDVQAFPDWSPDGGTIAYWSSLPGDSRGSIALHEVKTGRTSFLPGSEGKISPRWSPDGSKIAALSGEQKKLLIYDRRAGSWSERAAGTLLTGPSWSRDGSLLYFQDLLEADQPVYRVGPEAGAPERVAVFPEALVGGVSRVGFAGLTPDGDLLVVLSRNHTDIYALDLE
ncbi:MAG TPA: LpqB family beta-propeller domain-containing protein [Thermoanaerobaculia bacterium]|nr:LpqB family beta-propeller domain-containing protein [Thermoanaerobaculia bacterium]